MPVALLDHPAPIDGDATRRQFLIGGATLAALLIENEVVYGAARTFQGVLSLPLLFTELVPLVAAAVDGDPGTR